MASYTNNNQTSSHHVRSASTASYTNNNQTSSHHVRSASMASYNKNNQTSHHVRSATMASYTKKYQTSSHHVRSASFPPKANLLVQKIEQELQKLRKYEAFSTSVTQTITLGLTGLAGLYKCVDYALSLPLNQHSLPLSHQEINQLIDGMSKLLEICTGSRDALIRLREQVEDLDLKSERDVSNYYSTRKEIIRNTKGLTLSLSQMEASLVEQSAQPASQEAPEVSRALKCVSIISISVLESLLQFLMSKPKSSKPSFFSKLVGKSKVSSTEKCGNEMSQLDAVLHLGRSNDADKLQIAQKRLESLKVTLKGIENSLSTTGAQLTRIRTSLVNTVSL